MGLETIKKTIVETPVEVYLAATIAATAALTGLSYIMAKRERKKLEKGRKKSHDLNEQLESLHRSYLAERNSLNTVEEIAALDRKYVPRLEKIVGAKTN